MYFFANISNNLFSTNTYKTSVFFQLSSHKIQQRSIAKSSKLSEKFCISLYSSIYFDIKRKKCIIIFFVVVVILCIILSFMWWGYLFCMRLCDDVYWKWWVASFKDLLRRFHLWRFIVKFFMLRKYWFN